MKVAIDDQWCKIISATEEEQQELEEILTFEEEDEPDEGYVFLERTPFEEEQASAATICKFLTGLYDYVEREFSYPIEIESEQRLEPHRELPPVPDDYLDGISLRRYQKKAIQKSLMLKRGILEMPTRSGKTEVMVGIAKWYLENRNPDGRILVVEPTTDLMYQTYERFKDRGVQDVGRLNQDHKETGQSVVVGVRNSFYNISQDPEHPCYDDFTSATGIIVDEVHHLGAPSYALTFLSIPQLDIAIGVSGTPFNDEVDPYSNPRDVAIVGLLHRVIYKVTVPYLVRKNFLADPHVVWLKYKYRGREIFTKSWHNTYDRYILNNRWRNEKALSAIEQAYNAGLKVLVLVTRLDHGERILKGLEDIAPDSKFVSGGRKIRGLIQDGKPPNASWDVVDGLLYYPEEYPYKEKFSNGEFRVLIGSSIFDEGQDLPDLDCVVLLGGGGSSDVKNIQRPARALTNPGPGAKKVFIFDFWDDCHPYLKKHSKQRARSYDRNGYTIHRRLESIEHMLEDAQTNSGA